MKKVGTPCLAAVAAGLATLALGLGAAAWQREYNAKAAAERFDIVAARAVDQLARRMNTYDDGLRGARGAAIAFRPGFIDRESFRRYAESRDIEREFPGVRGFGLARRIAPADEAAFVEAVRNDGRPDFAVGQLQPHAGVRYVVQHFEPLERGRPGIGLDLASEPNRRRAADRAARTGEATLTGPLKLRLATDNAQPAFLILLPIYLPGSVPDSDDARSAAAYAWAFAPLAIDEVMRDFDFLGGEYTMTLSDVTGAPEVFFDPAQGAPAPLPALVRTHGIDTHGRRWQAELRATPLFVERLGQPPPAWTVAASALAALLVTLLAWQSLQNRERARWARDERRRRAAIVDASNDAIVSVDLQGRITDWNSSAERMFGFAAAEVIGGPVPDGLLPGDALAEDAGVRASIVRGEVVRAFDAVRCRRDGSSLDVSVTASPLFDADGRLIGFSKTLRDISEAKRAERELRELNEELERRIAHRTASLESARRHLVNVLDAMPSAIAYWDLEERNRFANRFARERYGIDADGKLLADAVGEHYPESQKHVRAVLHGSSRSFERAVVRGVGYGLRREIVHYLPDIVDGQVRGFYSLVHDITRLTLAEQKLRQHEVMLDRTSRVGQIGGWEHDVETGVTVWTDETCRIHELPPGYVPQLDEAIGYYAPEARPVITAAVRHGIETGIGWDLELPMITAKGRAIWVRAMGEVELRDGRPPRLFGAFQDVSKRHVLEDELRETRERFSGAALEAGIGMWEWQVGTETLTWDEGMYRINGVERREGENLFELWPRTIHPEDHEAGRAALDATLRDGTGMTIEFRIVRPGGEVRHVRSTVRLIRDAAGRPRVLTGVNIDITERKRAEAELREARERFSNVALEAGVGVWEWHVPSDTLVWDEGMYLLHGVARGDAGTLRREWVRLMHPEDAERCLGLLENALRGGAIEAHEFRVVRPARDGKASEVRHVRGSVRVIRDATGRPMVMTGVNIDITERKRAELELRETTALLRHVLDAASEVSIIAIDPDLKIRLFNRGAERMLGWTHAELTGLGTPDVFHDRDELIAMTKQRSAQLGRRLSHGELMIGADTLGQAREFTYVAKDGRRIPVSLVVTAMRGEDGEPLGYLGIAHDVTQQKLAEASLQTAKARAEQASLAKSQFLANMSHEIRTPMNAVINLVYLMAQGRLDDEQRELLDKLAFASRSLLAVINDILDVSKIEAGELSIERLPVALPGLLREIGAVMAVQARAKGLDLAVELAPDLPPAVWGDPLRLQQILNNLLSNAIKFTAQGRVRLVVQRAAGAGADALRFAVHDTGPGIEPEVQARLFAPFAQADVSTTRRFGGTGLGLSIVKRLAELMGGRVGLASVPGSGSEFWVELPLAPADAVQLQADETRLSQARDASPARQSQAALRGLRVLVVDDSDVNLDVARRILTLEGAQVALAAHGREALERLRAEPAGFDAVLMDVQMPVMDGHEATRRIRAEPSLAALPVIALTAGALTSERQRAEAAGMNDFVTKPFDARSLVACIRRHVHARGVAEAPAASAVPVVPPGGWPSIDGIDEADVRARLSDDLDLFRSTLRRVTGEFADLAEPADTAGSAPADLEAWRARMHRLRGSAGLLGATAVAAHAGAVERACEQQDEAAAARHREALGLAFAGLLRAARPFLAHEAASAMQAPDASYAPAPVDAAELDDAALARLLELLAQRSLAALDAFEALAPALGGRLGGLAFAALREHFEDLRFDRAAALLEPLRTHAPANADG